MMKIRTSFKILFLVISLLIFTTRLPAQRYHFRNYGVENGLAQSQVFSSLQCTHGYLWFGMYGGGLGRFDGTNFVNFSKKDGLNDNVVYSIIQDRQGLMWLGTDKGLCSSDGTSFTNYHKNAQPRPPAILSILEDRTGNLWLGTFESGLLYFDRESIVPFSTRQGPDLSSYKFGHIMEDQRGHLWFCTSKGLLIYDGSRFVSHPLARKIGPSPVAYLIQDSRGQLWASTKKNVYRFSADKITRCTTPDAAPIDNVSHIMEDSRGQFWFSTTTGLVRLKDHTFTHFNTRHGLPINEINHTMEDREGNIWISTEKGLSQFKGEMFTYITTAEGLPDETVWSFTQFPDGNMWLSTENGAVIYSPAHRSIRLLDREEFKHKALYPLYRDRLNHTWFGDGEKIFKYDGKTYTDISSAYKLGAFDVLSIFQDDRGGMWFGTNNRGVIKLSPRNRTARLFTTDDGLLSNTVNTINQHQDGRIWMGTEGGIAIYDGSAFSAVTTQQWLPISYINTILTDRDNHLWIGTYGGGVIRYASPGHGKEEHISIMNSSDGLGGDEIMSMCFDNPGRLWMGTNKGITMLDVPQFNQTGRKIFKFYAKEDGFSGIENNQNAIFKDSKGQLWFGTINGAVTYNPARDVPNPVEPLVHITNLKLFFEETDLSPYTAGKPNPGKLTAGLNLPYEKNHLTFEFIGISLTVPEKVRYRVMLEGFDTAWLPPSKTPFATYSNLPPGQYTFKVHARNNSGVRSRRPASYSFSIKTPFWMTPWFYFLVIIAVLAAIFGFIRMRLIKMKRMQTFLEEQVQLRTMELEQEKEKVEHINLELEKRVEERTQKLASLNKQLIQAKKMEAIGTLAGGVAHDLNNVLSGIVSLPEIMLLDLPENSPMRQNLSTILKSGDRAAAIVQDLLTLARRSINISEVIDVNHIVTQFINSPELKKILSYHPDVRVETHLYDPLFNIKASPVHLSKALMNLVSNAAEAMPGGGVITIRTSNRDVEENRLNYGKPGVQPGGYVAISVTDTGTGISPDEMEHIFEPFYTKKKMDRSGTGLGMTVVWGTVEDHNGFIDVQSSEGKGTVFTLFFPVTHEKVPPAPNTPGRGIEDFMGGGQSILVVDDVPQQRDITSMMLTKLGYQTFDAPSGEEAIRFLKDNPVDLLVLDMIMDPGISGLETYERILKLYPGQKAIIVSGFTETREVKRARYLGCGAYLKKPFSLKQLGNAVKNELEPGGNKYNFNKYNNNKYNNSHEEEHHAPEY
jgi:ligand-binding sensor domain-containing protein/signal transduction histidine kinase/CheY-like chemotaxis protein